MIKAIYFQIQPLKCLLKNHKTMKKIILIFISAIIFFACKKEAPQPDYFQMCNGCYNYYTSHYILNTIDATIDNKDTVDNDTMKYNGFFIAVNMKGNVVTEQIYEYKMHDGTYRPVPIQAYFINKIQKIEIIPDKPYNDKNKVNITDFNVYFRDKETNYTLKTEYVNKELGYSPLKIKLTAPPDSSQWFTFTVKITDDKGNIFISSTNKIFVTKL